MSPSRRIAPWLGVMRRGSCACEYCVRNGGAIMTSRRVRSPAAHRSVDRAAACKTLSVCYLPSRAPRRWRAATGNGAAARWGHRALPQRDRTTGHGQGAASGHPTAPTGRPMPCSAPRTVPCALAPIGTKGSGFSAPNEDFRRISEQDDTVTVALRSGPCYPRCVAYLDRIVVWIGDP